MKKPYFNSLEHHGIKGQRWGVRRFQNYNGTLTAEGRARYGTNSGNDFFLPKGSTVNRITAATDSRDDKLRNEHKYLYTDADAKVYEGPFSIYTTYTSNLPVVAKSTYRTTEDIVAPSREKMMANFKERYNANRGNARINTDRMIRKLESTNHPVTRLDSWKNEDERRFLAYNVLLEANKREVDSIIKDFSKLKYNAIMDYNNLDIYNEAVEPFIVANAKKSLTRVSQQLLWQNEIINNYNEVKNELNKKGKSVTL